MLNRQILWIFVVETVELKNMHKTTYLPTGIPKYYFSFVDYQFFLRLVHNFLNLNALFIEKFASILFMM